MCNKIVDLRGNRKRYCMKANKKTLLAFRKMMETEQEYYDYDELIQTCIEETNLIRTPCTHEHSLATDECDIKWGEDEVCILSDFVDEFARIFLDKVLNMAESMIGEDIDDYFWDEE
jgi:hypothetical protein